MFLSSKYHVNRLIFSDRIILNTNEYGPWKSATC
ncbi:hypothetical protein SCFA_1330005 [anaerobic digester metagenome]|uniref:Uncharacterized protein n=1 Tax=anaerobic digester metagenome TaxID=1263854 RepID=A0A485LW51_9ZZZZ